MDRPADHSAQARGESLPAETVLGIDNVPITLPIARMGSRVLACFIDYIVVFVLVIAWIVGWITLQTWLRTGAGWAVAIAILGLFLIDYGYFAGLEIATGGRTIGKALFHLRVVTRAGGRPGPASLMIRNLVRSIDLLIGVPLGAIDPLARRLGDRLAGTLVVHEAGAGEQQTLRRVPRNWGPRQVAILESYLSRVEDLEADRAAALGRQLLDLIKRDDPEFLGGIDAELDPVEALRRATQADR
ncbi:MAG: RDD family protein [Acidobacteriota bacterium]